MGRLFQFNYLLLVALIIEMPHRRISPEKNQFISPGILFDA